MLLVWAWAGGLSAVEVTITFDGNGAETVQAGILELNLNSGTVTLTETNGTGELGTPGLSGDVSGLSGVLTFSFSALGTVAEPFNSNTFAGGVADGIFSTATEWTVNSDLNALSNTVPGQGIVFTLDSLNLGAGASVELTGVRWQNTVDGSRLSFRNEGQGDALGVYAGGGERGGDAVAALSQPLDADDQIAFWSVGGGQQRLKALTFDIQTSENLLQHLLADPAKIEFADGQADAVQTWLDQSGNLQHATQGVGTVRYPSALLSLSDLPGLDFGTDRNSLTLFSAAGSDTWLDFTGDAAGKSGFALLMALTFEAFEGDHSDLVGNDTDLSNGQGFFIRRRNFGDFLISLGASSLETTLGGEVGETVVLGINYNALTGMLTFYDTSNDQSVEVAVTPGDFSTAAAVTLGTATGNLRYLQGMVGEVRVYDSVLSEASWQSERAALIADWIQVDAVKVPRNIQVTDVGDERVQLIWDPDTSGDLFDSFRVYRSEVSGGPYVRVAEGLTTPEVVDTGMPGGQTYYYVIRAVDTAGLESADSVEVSAAPTAVVNLQVLDASQLNTLQLSGDQVIGWNDVTGAGVNAVAGVGTVRVSTDGFPAGQAGLDFGEGLNTLLALDAATAATYLGVENGGSTVMVSVRVADLVAGRFNTVVGNSTDGLSGFRLGFTSDGNVQATVNGVTVTSDVRQVVAGDTLVLALVVDPVAGEIRLWDSKNLQTVTTSYTGGVLDNGSAVSLGGVGSNYFNGDIGGFQWFASSLDDLQLQSRREDLIFAWLAPPNIVMVLVDDIAWYATPIRMDGRRPNSRTPALEMPNLETLASESMLFRNAYSGGPMCVPTRASLQTGMNTARHGFTVEYGITTEYDDGPTREIDGALLPQLPMVSNGVKKPLADSIQTIPEVLAPFGYRCAHYGKWHLDSDPAVEGYVESDGNTDNSPGTTFDREISLYVQDGIQDPKRIFEITNKAMAFMEKQVNADRPFYVQLSHYAAHEPRECFPESRARFQNLPGVVDYNNGRTDPNTIPHRGDPAVWLGMMYDLDQSLGQLMQKIEDLGIRNRTYVIYTSDNGYRHEWFEEVSNGTLFQPLHARKWWCWQGGLRIPLFVRGPDVPAGEVNTTTMTTFDYLPTFLEWAGGDPTSLQNIDGVSVAGLMRGEAPDPVFQERALFWHYPHYRTTLPHSAMLRGRDKLVYFYDMPVRYPNEDSLFLFDVWDDAGEFTNRYTNGSPQERALGDAMWTELQNHLTEVQAWVPKDNSAGYVQSTYDTFVTGSERADRGPLGFALDGNFSVRKVIPNEEDPTVNAPLDAWMASRGLDPTEMNLDPDGDRIPNLAEYYRATQPNVADAEVNGISLAYTAEGWEFRFAHRFDAAPGTFGVETSIDLLSWTPIGAVISEKVTGGDVNIFTVRPDWQNNWGFLRLLYP
jgi:arylsulfatase A-like enzyme